jgi:hypothetical protein
MPNDNKTEFKLIKQTPIYDSSEDPPGKLVVILL